VEFIHTLSIKAEEKDVESLFDSSERKGKFNLRSFACASSEGFELEEY
jgi:hypothetical protein